MTTITIFGREFNVYMLLAVAGVLAGFLYLGIYSLVGRKKNRSAAGGNIAGSNIAGGNIAVADVSLPSFENMCYVYIWAVLFGVVGAKLLYILVSLPDIIAAFRSCSGNWWPIVLAVIRGGFVYYGGSLGALLGVVLSCRYFRYRTHDYLEALTPALPLFHAFGRVGCHIVGCCYGCESSAQALFSVTYATSEYAPNGVPLVPVQMIEVLFEAALFVALAVIAFHRRALLSSGKPLRKAPRESVAVIDIYLVAYAVFRFILEFYRGDSVRGIFFGLSTSQWIGIFIIIGVVLWRVVPRPRTAAQKTDVPKE